MLQYIFKYPVIEVVCPNINLLHTIYLINEFKYNLID